MNLARASSLLISLLSATSTLAHDDFGVPQRGIQVIAEGDDCVGMFDSRRDLKEEDEAAGGLRKLHEPEEKRCAVTLFPPDASYRYLPDVVSARLVFVLFPHEC